MKVDMSIDRPARLASAVGFAVALFAGAWALLEAVRGMHTVATAWPMDAIVAAVMVRWARDWNERRLILALTFVAFAAADVLDGSTVVQAAGMAALNLCDIAFAAWLVGKVGHPIDSLKAFAAFVAGAVLAMPAATGAAAAGLFALTDPNARPLEVGLRWAASCGLGMVIVGAFALTVRKPRRDEGLRSWLQFLAGQAVVVIGVTAILLRPNTPPLFLLFPFVVAGALSHRELGGVTAVAITAVLVWITSSLGLGTAAVADFASVDRIAVTEVLLAALVFTVLPISALLRRLDAVADALREDRARAEEMNALKARLLAYVSHEIRSPLSGVTALAQLMRDGAFGELTAPQRESADRIALAGAEVDQLARDLTDAAAIEAGKARVTIGAVEVGEAIRTAVEAARFRVAEYRGEVEIAVMACSGSCVAADPMRVRQILLNLIVNGAKYGGRPARVRIGAVETARGTIRFEVSDNGKGIPAERRANLFKDFERLGAERSGLEGAGLGLALSSQIARLQNGALGVEDGEMGGSLFWLELPLWCEDAAAA
jgi:signal transduction histidine kinase